MQGKSYRRPLDTTSLALEFVRRVMGIEDIDKASIIATEVMNEEMVLEKLENKSSLNNTNYRNARYLSEDARKTLRKQIVSELIYLERLANDDDIILGKGGARPREIRKEKTAIIITGSPASGKSKVATILADHYGAFLLDSDYAKRKLPEYNDRRGGASYVHEESDSLVSGKQDSLFEYCIFEGANMAIPIVGKSLNTIEQLIEKIKQTDYSIHFVNVALDRCDCLTRAVNRFIETGRYVPLSYIFDEVANEPERIYYVVKRKYKNKKNSFSSFALLTNDVPKGQYPLIIEADKNSPVIGVFMKQ